MNSKQLIFTSDCVINFDDLPEIKDYRDVVHDLAEKLANRKQKQSLMEVIDLEVLQEVLEADPEDTHYLPDFPKMFNQLTEMDQHSQLQSLPISIAMLETYYVILTQWILDSKDQTEFNPKKIGQIVLKRAVRGQTLIRFLGFLYKLSESMVFVQQEEMLCKMLLALPEQEIFQDNEVATAYYLEVCERVTKSKKIRQCLRHIFKQSQQSNIWLQLKLSLWAVDLKTTEQLSKKLSKYSENYLLREALGQ